jgi:membrane protein YdbS with pleckstrin-like domain
MSDTDAVDPSSETVAIHPLPRSILVLWRAGAGLFALVLIAAAAVGGWAIGETVATVLLLAAAVVVGVLTVIVVELRFRSWRWGLDRRWVEQCSGVIVRRTQLVPRSRVQTLTTRTGPVDRWLGLSSIVVHTAGTHTPNLVIPHLRADDASRLRAELGTDTEPPG